MTRTRKASAELYFVLSAVVGAVLAAAVSRVPSLGFSFLQFLTIMLSADVVTYIAMKAGWMNAPGAGG